MQRGHRTPLGGNFVVFTQGPATMSAIPRASGGGTAMWTCPKCKIDVEPQFELCWACGTSRDGEQTSSFNPEAEGIMGADEYAAETEAKRREDFVTLATFWNAPEAHVVRSRLE